MENIPPRPVPTQLPFLGLDTVFQSLRVHVMCWQSQVVSILRDRFNITYFMEKKMITKNQYVGLLQSCTSGVYIYVSRMLLWMSKLTSWRVA